MRLLLLVFLLAAAGGRGAAAEAPPLFLSLQGFLDGEKLSAPAQALKPLQSKDSPSQLVLELDSSSGDLEAVLSFARAIYERKQLHGLKVVVYIHHQALGPAALLPFLADELSGSLSFSWGDIPLGSDGGVPANLLRSRVRGLIDPAGAHAALLQVLADAMSDPALQVVDEGGWKIVSRSAPGGASFISTPGEPLVVNQNQLLELGLVAALFPPSELEKRYAIEQARAVTGKEDSLEPSRQSVEKRLGASIRVHSDGPNPVGALYIGDHESSISESTWLYVKQGLEFYKKEKPIFIILRLNTPGGEVFAAQKIADALKEMDTQFGIPIVALIDDWAISAGAMLAYSCRFIATAKDGSMGAAEPVYVGEGGKMEAASEKVTSALRTDFANRARFFGRSPLIAEAMVDKDLLVVLRHGHIVRLEQESQLRLTGPDPDLVISSKGKLLTLDAAQMLEYGVADLVLPSRQLPSRGAAEAWPVDERLLFQAPFFSSIPHVTVKHYQMDWKTRFFVFLATPFVSSLLLMGLVVGAYLELSSPGFGLPGLVAASCLFLIALSSLSLEIAHWLELILLLTGAALLLLELFVLPTFGVLGFLGALLFLAGLLGMLLPNLHEVLFHYDAAAVRTAARSLLVRLAWLCGSLLFSVLVIVLLGRYALPSFSGFRRFVLVGHEQEASKGFVAGEDPEHLPRVGARGRVFASLRPAGKIEIGGNLYDAVSTRDLIEAGETIVVERLEGSVIFVRRMEES